MGPVLLVDLLLLVQYVVDVFLETANSLFLVGPVLGHLVLMGRLQPVPLSDE